jgi:type I restriction enzyme R subunit
MAFTELNTVEHYIVNKLTGVNLNSSILGEPKVSYGFEWIYKSTEQLNRGVNEVMVETELREALIRINPEIAEKPERADEVIYKLRAILISVNQTGLVRANEEFSKWLTGDKTMPFGENNRHVPVSLIDFDPTSNKNTYIVTNQYRIHHRETKIPDIVLLINGIPVVVGEAKTPIRPSVSWLDGAYEIHDIYENAVPQLFVPNVFSFRILGSLADGRQR